MFHRPALPPGGSVYACGTPGEFDGYAMTDGTVKRGWAACAYVLLDRQGREMAARWSRLAAPTRDSTEAEFAALAMALDAAHAHGLRRLWVGTDSFQLIEHALKRSAGYRPYVGSLDQARERFEHLYVQAIARRHNARADGLARQGVAHLR